MKFNEVIGLIIQFFLVFTIFFVILIIPFLIFFLIFIPENGLKYAINLNLISSIFGSVVTITLDQKS